MVITATSGEVRDKLDDLRRELRLGNLAPAGPAVTLAAYLTEWIQRDQARVRRSTWRAVRRMSAFIRSRRSAG